MQQGPRWGQWWAPWENNAARNGMVLTCTGCKAFNNKGLIRYCKAPTFDEQMKIGRTNLTPDWCPAQTGDWGTVPELKEEEQGD